MIIRVSGRYEQRKRQTKVRETDIDRGRKAFIQHVNIPTHPFLHPSIHPFNNSLTSQAVRRALLKALATQQRTRQKKDKRPSLYILDLRIIQCRSHQPPHVAPGPLKCGKCHQGTEIFIVFNFFFFIS